MDIESQRVENLKQKQKLLAELNLQSNEVSKPGYRDSGRRHTKKRKFSFENRPTRTSARIASSDVKPSYDDDAGETYTLVDRPARTKSKGNKQSATQVKLANDLGDIDPAPDADDIRARWTKWTAVATLPTRDEDATFHFDDFPDFSPNKSPEEVIREGCFGGSYFRRLKSRKLGILIEDDWEELPTEWYSGVDVSQYLTSPVSNSAINKFGVACGQSIEEWEAAGWIAYEYDIRGWFQWYCRFFLGRRCHDDDRQVSRWRKCVGQTGRWRRMLLKKYLQMGVREVFDDGEDDREVSPVMHQTCHHWAYEVRQQDLDAAWSDR